MVRAFHRILHLPGNPIKQHRRQFVPSIAGAASCLEDRALLNGGGGSAHAAVANLAHTPAGRHVTRMYEKVLGGAPTQQQVTQLVQEVRSGTSFAALHEQLVVEARTQAAASGGSLPMNSSVGPIVVGSGSTSGNGPVTPATPLPPGLINSHLRPVSRRISLPRPTNPPNSAVGPIVANSTAGQLQAGRSATRAFSGGAFAGTRSLTFSFAPINRTGSSVSQQTGTPTLIPTPAAGTTGMMTGTTTSGSPLASLVGSGTVPTPLGTLTNPTVTTTGPQGTLTFTPTTFITTPANFSPVPANGVLPFTGTPFNPSPVPANGVLPFTGTPFNPSPVPANGVLPFTGTPFNPSPVAPTTGVVLV